MQTKRVHIVLPERDLDLIDAIVKNKKSTDNRLMLRYKDRTDFIKTAIFNQVCIDTYIIELPVSGEIDPNLSDALAEWGRQDMSNPFGFGLEDKKQKESKKRSD